VWFAQVLVLASFTPDGNGYSPVAYFAIYAVNSDLWGGGSLGYGPFKEQGTIQGLIDAP
jgi:hypothetical protein